MGGFCLTIKFLIYFECREKRKEIRKNQQGLTTEEQDYQHPWTKSCTQGAADIYRDALLFSLKTYSTVYFVALLLRGKIPKVEDLKKSFQGLVQSTTFLSSNAYFYVLLICTLRNCLGSVNYFTITFLPTFIGSLLAIFIERPSRRGMLALYVSNIATECVYRMGLRRNLFKPVPFGDVYIVMASTAALLYVFKSQNCNDPVVKMLRFVVGDYEEHGYTAVTEEKNSVDSEESHDLPLIVQLVRKTGKHKFCLHPHGCLSYTLEGGLKLFSAGYGLQACMTLFFKRKALMSKPSLALPLFFGKESCQLGLFLGGFSAIFRFMSCLLRWTRNKDSNYHGLLAGLAAGIAYSKYRSNTIALYVLWKTLQVVYNAGVHDGHLPSIPWGTELLYSLSTAILFNGAVQEPSTIRPSYWSFLMGMSGQRVAEMNKMSNNFFDYGGAKFNVF